MRTFVILNPIAGGGRAGLKWPQTSALIKDALGAFESARTNAPGDATHLARKAIAEGVELIVSVGGDGTANEVANGIVSSDGATAKNCKLAVVPCGTGSDFCRTLGFAADPSIAISRIAKRSTRAIDVGVASYCSNDGALASRAFLNIASFGLSGMISRNVGTATRLPLLPIRLRYLIETFRSLSSYRPVDVRVSVDEQVIEGKVMFVAIANGRYFGGGMMVAPDADLRDGLLDVIVLRAISRTRLARKISLVYRGAHLKLPEIEVIRGSRIIVEALGDTDKTGVFVETDGENPGTLDCEFSIQPKALRLVQ